MRIYLILVASTVGCCGCMLDVVICGDRCGDQARCALKRVGNIRIYLILVACGIKF